MRPNIRRSLPLVSAQMEKESEASAEGGHRGLTRSHLLQPKCGACVLIVSESGAAKNPIFANGYMPLRGRRNDHCCGTAVWRACGFFGPACLDKPFDAS